VLINEVKMELGKLDGKTIITYFKVDVQASDWKLIPKVRGNGERRGRGRGKNRRREE
jgi:hypothetical protein